MWACGGVRVWDSDPSIQGWFSWLPTPPITTVSYSNGSAARRRLCSASTSDLVVPSTHRASIGDRAFAVAGPRAWNSLPPALCSTSTSFITFKKELQSFLFGLSFSLWQRILFIDYVQCSSSSLYRILRYRNRLNYITLHYTPGVMPASWSTLWRSSESTGNY